MIAWAVEDFFSFVQIYYALVV